MSQEFYHDFVTHRPLVRIFGRFTVPRKPTPLFVLIIFFNLFAFGLFVFIFYVSLLTVMLEPDDKFLVSRSIINFILTISALVLPLCNVIGGNDLEEAIILVKCGIYKYVHVLPEEDQEQILAKSVKKVKTLDNLLFTMIMICIVSNTTVLSLVQFALGSNKDDSVVKPYLPLAVYMPFDTSTVLGFGVAFTLHFLFIAFAYTSMFCYLMTYISTTLQLVFHLEMLNKSLGNLEKRAYFKLLREKGSISIQFPEGMLEFHECLYSCLRENILHHQAILRYKKSITGFTQTLSLIALLLVSVNMAASIIAVTESPGFNAFVTITAAYAQFAYFQMCRVGQIVADESGKLKEAVYSTPWPIAGKKFNNLLKIMLINTQKPIVIKAGGFNSDVSLKTYGDSVSLGYKVISVLR